MKILFVNYYKLDLTLIECENIFSWVPITISMSCQLASDSSAPPLVHCVWMWWYVNWQLCAFQVSWTMSLDQIPPSINRDITPSHTKSLDIPALPPCLPLVLPTFRWIRLENICLKKCRFQCASAVRCASWWSPKIWAMTSAGGSSCVTTTGTIRQSATAMTNRRYHLALSNLRLRSTVS